MTSLPTEMDCAMWRGVDDMRLERRSIPDLIGREVLIRVAACGICATDLHLLDGSIPLYTPPRVLGHEMSGTVVGVGPRPAPSRSAQPSRSTRTCRADRA